ncbi:putative zinc-binding protein [Thalassotalea aquiviva]|uniref:putative zinc-binding protein n=1 Tax=Thalassotalea aquiviva TaxID=3242415 RepID=UPI00352AECAF
MKNTIIYSCTSINACAWKCRHGQIGQSIAKSMDKDNFGQLLKIDNVSIQQAHIDGNPVVAIDGCTQGCALSAINAHQFQPKFYINLSNFDAEIVDNWGTSLLDNFVLLKTIYQSLDEQGFSFQ